MAATYFPRRSRLIAFTIGTFTLLLASIAIMLSLESLQYGILRLIALIIGFIGVVLSGYAFFFNTVRLSRPQPILHSDSEGISFHISPLLYGNITWADIRAFSLVQYAGRKILLVQLHDPFRLINSAKGLRKLRLRANHKRYGSPFAIPAGLLPEDAESILRELDDGNSEQ